MYNNASRYYSKNSFKRKKTRPLRNRFLTAGLLTRTYLLANILAPHKKSIPAQPDLIACLAFGNVVLSRAAVLEDQEQLRAVRADLPRSVFRAMRTEAAAVRIIRREAAKAT